MGHGNVTGGDSDPPRSRERAASAVGAITALAALVLLASWVGGLLGPDPDGLDDIGDAAAALAGLGLFGLGCWLVPAAARRAGRLAGADPARADPGLLDALVLLTLACALGMAALALVVAVAYRR